MIVKVIIKRTVIKGKEQEFFASLKNLRIHAMNQKGYITGETLISAKQNRKVVVISKWESLEAWENWKNSEIKRPFDETIEALIESPTEYEPCVFSKFWAVASVGFPPPLQKINLD